MTYLYRLPDDCTKEDYREAIFIQSEEIMFINEYLEDYMGLQFDPNNLIGGSKNV